MVWTALIKSVNTTGKNQQQIMQVRGNRACVACSHVCCVSVCLMCAVSCLVCAVCVSVCVSLSG